MLAALSLIIEAITVAPSADGTASLSRDRDAHGPLVLAEDVDWDALNDNVSRDLGFRVDLNYTNAPNVAEGLERGLREGGCMRHGKGTCAWLGEVKYEGVQVYRIRI